MADADICAPGTECSNGPDSLKHGVKRPVDANGDSDDIECKKPNLSNNSDAITVMNPTKPAINTNPLGSMPKTVIHKIPDKYVGLIIGKKGEQIVQIQNQHNCKVQIDQTSNGMPDRNITIVGTPAQIEGVKKSMADLIEKAEMINNASNGNGDPKSSRFEILIPGPKCGLVIGKSGETIKQLQETHGVKMVILQESNMPTLHDKTLVLTGDPSKVEKAREAVRQLIAMKEGESAPSGIITGEGREVKTYAVPVEVAGLVIGKRGETIKEIIRLSGAYVEIQRQAPPNPNIKIFNINGTTEQCDHAIKLICDRANLPPPSAQAMPYQGYGQNYGQYPSTYGTPAMPAPSVNPATGQPDYTAAWAEYYRRQGMHEYANQLTSQSPTGQMTSTNTSQPPYDYSQWQQYSQQWQQWQQQWAAYQQQSQPNSGS